VLRCPQDRLVPRKRLGMRRTQQQTPEPQGAVAIEMAGTERRSPGRNHWRAAHLRLRWPRSPAEDIICSLA
jgi:hypothetical protein